MRGPFPVRNPPVAGVPCETRQEYLSNQSRIMVGLMSFSSATFSICTAILMCLLAPATAEQAPAKRAVNRPSETTLFLDCHGNEKPKRVLSSVALSEGKTWRAYVEVNVQSNLGCLHTTRLWVARANRPYRLGYLVPPP